MIAPNDRMKTLDQLQKAISHAVSRAYDLPLAPHQIGAEHAGRDVRSFIQRTAGHPHKDLGVAQVAALALSRAGKMSGDEALASTIADLIDGGVSLDRQAAAPRGLEAFMTRHRGTRARSNPLPADLKARKRDAAPRVIRRAGGAAVRVRPAAGGTSPRAKVGARIRYRRLDDDTEHAIVLGPAGGAAASGHAERSIPMGSPLAQALLGATKGSVVPVVLGGNAVELEVLEVSA